MHHCVGDDVTKNPPYAFIITHRASWTRSSRSGRFTPGKKLVTHSMGGLGGPQSWSGRYGEEKKRLSPGRPDPTPTTLPGLPVTHKNLLTEYPWRAWKLT